MQDEQHKQEAHWRELAALLGVDPDAGARTAATVKTSPAAVPEPEPASSPLGQFQEEQAPLAKSQPVMHVDVEEKVEAPREEAAPSAVDEVRKERPEEEERPRRGRQRRGRRGRRDRGEREERTSEEENEPRGRDVDEDIESREPIEEPLAESDEEEATTPESAPAVGDDDEEDDTLSDWNVPSWNELIASLYRPER